MGVMHVRRRTTQEWADQNPILAKDQMALDTETDEFRIGDGETRWSKLPNYSRKGSSGGGGTISFADSTVTEEFLNGLEGRLAALEGVEAITVVPHGDDPDYPRPAGIRVAYWLGSVEPVNAIDDDLLSLEVDVP